MKREPTVADLAGSRRYYAVGSSDVEVNVGGGVLVRYTLDLAASVTPGGTVAHTYWSGGGDCNEWAVENCFLTAYDMAWTTTSQSMLISLGDSGGGGEDDLIEPFNINAITGNPITRPSTPNWLGLFGVARRNFDDASYHVAWPVTVGGSGNFSIFSGLTLGIDATGITGSITDGFIQATVLLIPFW